MLADAELHRQLSCTKQCHHFNKHGGARFLFTPPHSKLRFKALLTGLPGFSCNSRPSTRPKGVSLSILPVPLKAEVTTTIFIVELNQYLGMVHSFLQTRDTRPQVEAPCQFCPKIFSHKKHLKRHIDMKHTNQLNPLDESGNKDNGEEAFQYDAIFKCQVCNKIFSSEEILEKHGKTHVEGGGGFPCGKCEKSFLTRKRLKKHMRSHMEFTNQCDVCEKAFQNPGTLALHKNIHLDQKPFKCETCEKDFSQKGNLKTHMQKHHGLEMNDSNISMVIAGNATVEDEME